MKKEKRGYFGIGIYLPKTETNLGTLWRSAFNSNVSKCCSSGINNNV